MGKESACPAAGFPGRKKLEASRPFLQPQVEALSHGHACSRDENRIQAGMSGARHDSVRGMGGRFREGAFEGTTTQRERVTASPGCQPTVDLDAAKSLARLKARDAGAHPASKELASAEERRLEAKVYEKERETKPSLRLRRVFVRDRVSGREGDRPLQS